VWLNVLVSQDPLTERREDRSRNVACPQTVPKPTRRKYVYSCSRDDISPRCVLWCHVTRSSQTSPIPLEPQHSLLWRRLVILGLMAHLCCLGNPRETHAP
jgi:hypothetical protein